MPRRQQAPQHSGACHDLSDTQRHVRLPQDCGTRLYFVTVPEPKTTKNRVHLDVIPRDRSQEQEIARLVGLGAAVSVGQPPGAAWVVLADPEATSSASNPANESQVARSP